MYQNQELGRPKSLDQELKFKENYLQNEERIELECQTIFSIYTIFFSSNFQQVSEERLKEFLKQYSCEHIYQILNSDALEKYELSPEEYCKFTSKRDIRLFLSFLNNKLKRSLTSSEILMFAACYFKQKILVTFRKIKLMNTHFLTYIEKTLLNSNFQKIMFNGPISNCDEEIIVFNKLAHWMLTLLKLEGIKLRRKTYQKNGNKNSQNELTMQLSDCSDSSPTQT